MKKTTMIIVAAIAASACGGPGGAGAPKAPSAKCPVPGSEDKFTKVMNPSFSPDYEGCEVRVTVKLHSSNSMMQKNLSPDASKLVLEVLDPGGATIDFVTAPKSAGDVVLAAKSGDALVLTGGTVAWPYGGTKTHYFAATKIETP